MVLIPCIPDTCLPACPAQRIAAFEAGFQESYLAEYPTQPPPCLPQAYTGFVLQHHGGTPVKNRFKTQNNTERFIGLFLNFLEPQDLHGPITPTWRYGVAEPAQPENDLRLDYHMTRFSQDDGYFWERIGVHLLAFAAIDTDGIPPQDMASFDLLCFDYSNPTQPGIVTWDNRESWQDHQVTEPVCDSFEALAALLY